MAWLLGEVLIALAIAGVIVWWTFPKGHRERPPADEPEDRPR